MEIPFPGHHLQLLYRRERQFLRDCSSCLVHSHVAVRSIREPFVMMIAAAVSGSQETGCGEQCLRDAISPDGRSQLQIRAGPDWLL